MTVLTMPPVAFIFVTELLAVLSYDRLGVPFRVPSAGVPEAPPTRTL